MDGFNVPSGRTPVMHVTRSGISFNSVDFFVILDLDTGNVIFDANIPIFSLNDNTIETLTVGEIETNRVVSPIDKDLLIQSDVGLSLVSTGRISPLDFRTVVLSLSF